jgi:hypothetical protein
VTARWRGAVVVAAALTAPLACSKPRDVSPLPVVSPGVDELFAEMPMIMVQLKPGEQLARAMDLTLFGTFVPGLSSVEAEQRAGSPRQLLRGSYHENWRYARYETGQSFVDVAYEPSSSGCATFHRRTLYAYPKGRPWPVAAVFNEDFVARLRLSTGRRRLLVISSDGKERVWCLVKGEGVELLNWFRDPAE